MYDILLCFNRNARMSCQGENIRSVDLTKWKTASPNFIIPDQMLQESIERAKRDISNMRDSEWNLWEARECTAFVEPPLGFSVIYGHSGDLVPL